ncbi:DUF3037 domain-containing protein [Stenotrophomonas sp. Betaine-02u-21]|uniref:DUF3037 domain-containing protein n=1 Tax=unclassified Stenotrophomonas TaxID=196198 RepID=UPI000C333D47|nr:MULTISPECIES: DUF3037 domain-containing protein [unclassified Stenotrophomonas]PKH70328.1 DUF3037 domain-containing protein [Stenotrophomonas sp. Betaine-02u-23]PKH72268.1 DUF3037 domain-containing protein [Stenotrophomonas sp. Betaine-02u-21]PKH96114.1 DUF3037 domain-containing protein [Stenotrophomonas sp. Bg11-02]
MKTKYACQYVIVRFVPYAETGEFANVGIVVSCPGTGFFGARFSPVNRTQRVTDFFQGLGPRIYREALKYVKAEIDRMAVEVGQGRVDASFAFDSATRPREALVTFSTARVILGESPRATLDALYKRFIERDFATKEYHEKILTNGVGHLLVGARLKPYFSDATVGDDTFNVKFPFVSINPDAPKVAIKPLFLGQDEPNKIFEHGDPWVAKIARLEKRRRLPSRTLFAVGWPADGGNINKRQQAARDVASELMARGVQVVDVSDTGAILEFAEQAKPIY